MQIRSRPGHLTPEEPGADTGRTVGSVAGSLWRAP